MPPPPSHSPIAHDGQAADPDLASVIGLVLGQAPLQAGYATLTAGCSTRTVAHTATLSAHARTATHSNPASNHDAGPCSQLAVAGPCSQLAVAGPPRTWWSGGPTTCSAVLGGEWLTQKCRWQKGEHIGQRSTYYSPLNSNRHFKPVFKSAFGGGGGSPTTPFTQENHQSRVPNCQHGI